MSCVKTGGIFYLVENDLYIYGDLHSIGNCYVLYHTGMQDGSSIDKDRLDGTITATPEWFNREGKPYHTAVFPKYQLRMTERLRKYLGN